jgi:hypothetical protein
MKLCGQQSGNDEFIVVNLCVKVKEYDLRSWLQELRSRLSYAML